MSPGFLEQAARSLRAETAGAGHPGIGDRADAGDRVEQTLARVVARVRRRARLRRTLTVVGLQAGLATFGFGAWAAASGRLSSLIEEIRSAVTTPAPAPRAPRRTTRRTALVPPAAAPASTPALAPVAPTADPTSAAIRRKPARAPAARAIDQIPTDAPDAPDGDDENTRYREAHQAHFVKRDFAAAVAAWDRYLALPRPGRLALEARYNRAIALYRLGRRDEAAHAMQPFADGDYGPYRQAEARALLKQP
jgi:hypothetical protein